MVPVTRIGRTPLQTILVDYAGLENFSFHLVEYADEMQELYEALLENFLSWWRSPRRAGRYQRH